jgi:hypothetical protein
MNVNDSHRLHAIIRPHRGAFLSPCGAGREEVDFPWARRPASGHPSLVLTFGITVTYSV